MIRDTWRLKHFPGQHNQLSHGGKSFVQDGSSLGELYHGGSKKINRVDPDRLQSRDSGYYGRGFYTTATPEYAKTYGGRITKVRIKPDASVLVASLRRENAPDGLFDAVKKLHFEVWESRGIERRTPRSQWDDMFDAETSNPVGWKNAVLVYASHMEHRGNAFDVIRWSNGEIVIRNLDSIEELS